MAELKQTQKAAVIIVSPLDSIPPWQASRRHLLERERRFPLRGSGLPHA
jgi:hypothetical protein